MKRLDNTPSPQLELKSLIQFDLRTYNTTYMESIGSQFIQKPMDHVDLHTQLFLAQVQDGASIDAH